MLPDKLKENVACITGPYRRVVSCSNMMHFVEPHVYLAQHVAATYNKGANTVRVATIYILQCNNIARQVERKCPYYWTVKLMHLFQQCEATFVNKMAKIRQETEAAIHEVSINTVTQSLLFCIGSEKQF